ncbi:MAG: rod shape-determining protein RodA, partial [Acidobacteriota bacterium]
MMVDRQLFREFDWLLLGLVVLLSLLGAFFIYSSSHFLPGNYCLRQIIWIGISLVALFLVAAVDYKFLVSFSLTFYCLILAALAVSLVMTRLIAGTKSWLRVGIFQFQPSELAKIVMILVLARLFAEYKGRFLSLRAAVLALLLAGIPLVLVIAQPDLGTALTMFFVVAAAFILAGLKRKTIILFLALSLVIGVGGWNFGLKDYQKKRLTTLVNPGQDVRGSGYQIMQSKIAIGSGGLAGKGFMKGSQSQLRFLPARHTDFIFSVIGEEFGFLGVAAVLLVYGLMLARMFWSVTKARDRAGVYIVFMASMLIAGQALINILMIIGLFPVTGVPLPFLSYGGSSLLSNYLACGLILN